MKILEMLPVLDGKALATVLSNAVRLAEAGTPKQREQARTVIPLVEAEQSRRALAEPAPTRAVKPRATKARSAPKRTDA